MGAPLRHLAPKFAELLDGRDGVEQRGLEAGEHRIGDDPALVDLLADNIRIAVREGLVGEWQLGEAIGRWLTGRG